MSQYIHSFYVILILVRTKNKNPLELHHVTVPVRNLGSEPIKQVLEELGVEAAHIRHYAQLIHFGVCHVVRCEEGRDGEVLFCDLTEGGCDITRVRRSVMCVSVVCVCVCDETMHRCRNLDQSVILIKN